MNSRHRAVLDPKVLVNYLHYGREAVGGARSRRDDLVFIGLI